MKVKQELKREDSRTSVMRLEWVCWGWGGLRKRPMVLCKYI